MDVLIGFLNVIFYFTFLLLMIFPCKPTFLCLCTNPMYYFFIFRKNFQMTVKCKKKKKNI